MSWSTQDAINLIMVKKKKILYVITKSNYGGAQRYIHDLAINLPRDLFDVVVAFGGTGEQGAPTGSLKSALEKSGVRTIVINNFMRDMSLFTDIKAFFELLRVVRNDTVPDHGCCRGTPGRSERRFPGPGRDYHL